MRGLATTPADPGPGEHRRRRRLALSAAVLLALAGPRPAAAAPATPSDMCGTCHRDIYRMWRASAHARSMDDVVFLGAWRETATRDGQVVARLCLPCHAPLADSNGDPAIEKRVTWEGVSCEACHSLASVDVTPEGIRQVFDVGPVKRGPIRDATSPAHEVAYSALHTSALACAGCHEFRNAEGVPIITTYSEWQQSAAGRAQRTCQRCHMDLTRADVVDPKVKRIQASVNLHQVPGGHSVEQLNKALAVTSSATREADTLVMTVRVTNKGAGHAVPTGMPGRRVILAVEIHTADGKAFQERRVYTKTFLDAAGQPIVRDAGFFALGIRLETDSRIAPDAQRVETFRFPVAATATAQATVRLHYEHTPTGGPEDRTWLTFYTEDRTYPPAAR